MVLARLISVDESSRFSQVAQVPRATADAPVNDSRYWNAAARDWVIDSSTFDVWVGGDSTAELATTFEVTEA